MLLFILCLQSSSWLADLQSVQCQRWPAVESFFLTSVAINCAVIIGEQCSSFLLSLFNMRRYLMLRLFKWIQSTFNTRSSLSVHKSAMCYSRVFHECLCVCLDVVHLYESVLWWFDEAASWHFAAGLLYNCMQICEISQRWRQFNVLLCWDEQFQRKYSWAHFEF